MIKEMIHDKIPEEPRQGIFENPDYTRSMRIDTLRHRF